MKRLIAALLPTLMLGLSPAFAGDYATQRESSAQSQQTAEQQQLPADADKAQPGQNNAKKHPPTAVMDRAMPAEKAKDDTATKGKHPPASVMGRATPDLKSPNSKSDDSQPSSDSTSTPGTSK